MSLTQPDPILHAFAFSASGSYIQTIPDSPTGNAHASWQEGFPPVTFTPLASGGSPPFGADFNGVLNAISANDQWVQAGMLFTFVSSLSGVLSGYPLGALLQSSDRKTVWQSKVAANTHDPATLANIGTYWFPVSGEATVGLIRLAAVSGSANAIVLTSPINPAPMGGGTAIHQTLYFVAGSNNTSTVTVAVDGASAVALHNNAGGALAADDLVSGTLYQIIYNGTDWQVSMPVPSQTGAQFFVTQNDVTGSRVLATTYNNPSATKPMFVSISGQSGGAGGDLLLTINTITVCEFGQAAASAAVYVNGMVPPGGTYKVTCPTGAISAIGRWVETY